MKKDTEVTDKTGYEVTVICRNCGFGGTVTIRRGYPITQKPCPRCGCAELCREKTWE